ncbi:aldose epimerase family protein [Sunxiuqinia sp. A32]|uniref:aldose epimerase family protein n=1 Tax=Sunxiuqinia sp. A32 TaxID=3461496 RepID=UPI0040461F2C
MKIDQHSFGKTIDGKETTLFVLSNGNVEVSITNFGGIITSLIVPDKEGKSENIVLGFDDVSEYQSDQYLENCHYFGCIVGRVCNRITKGKFTLNGKDYQLPINNGDRHIHGGIEGFDKKIWDAKTINEENRVGLELQYFSKDGEEGYPGNLTTIVHYWLTKENELIIDYAAKTDRPTIINLTNHTYFNLTGGAENILQHYLQVPASTYTELDDLMPTGRILNVEGTPFDFRKESMIGSRIDQLPDGYDLNFPLDEAVTGDTRFAGVLKETKSGRFIEVYTTQPALQIYAGYYIPELIIDGKKKFGKYAGFALETQHYPDAINHPNFPSIVLNPEDNFHEKTIYKFGVKKD